MNTPIVSWEEMDSMIESEIYEFRKIKSGIHIALLGTTRGGKTTVAIGGGNPNRGILRHWDDALILDTTGDPGAISDYGKPVQKYGAIHGHRRLTVSDMTPKTKERVYKYIQRAVAQRHVAIFADEVRQLADKKFFGLGAVLDHVWLFCAKQDASLIGGTQAPRWVPSAFYDQTKLQLIFGIRDKRSMIRLAEISGDTDTLKAVIPQLKRFQFAHVGLDGDITISKFEMKTAPERQAEKRVRIYAT